MKVPARASDGKSRHDLSGGFLIHPLPCDLGDLQEAPAKYGTPEIFNMDQGSQFTSVAFTDRLKHDGIAISMNGKGRWCDNVFVERFWRSLKYEHVYLHAHESVSEASNKTGRYIEFFNGQPPHSSLKAQTPDQVYFHPPPDALAA